MEQVSDIN